MAQNPYTRWQSKARKAAKKHYSGHRRGWVHAACGSGKTLLGQRIHEDLGSKITLVLCPTITLVAQNLASYLENSKKKDKLDENYLVVCSDEQTIDSVTERASEFNLSPTTDPKTIAEVIRKRRGEPLVIFSTYQSTPAIVAAQEMPRVRGFDLMILDEAHRTATGGKRGSGLFKICLDDDKIKSHRRLGLTATPRIYSQRVMAKAEVEGYDISSMDDVDVYGECIYSYNFRKAIDDTVLVPYKVVVIGVTKEEIKEVIKSRDYINQDGEAVDAETVASNIGLHKAMKNHDLKRIIVFNRLIADARTFANPDSKNSFQFTLRAIGEDPDALSVEYISGSMRMKERMSKLNFLSNATIPAIVSNAKCLTEGIDVDDLDGVSFMMPKKSMIDIAQAIGRAIRKGKKNEAKSCGYIVLPVIIDEEEDVDACLDESAYERVAMVLRRLMEIDDDLREAITAFRVSIGEKKPSSVQSTQFLKDAIAVEDIPEGLNAKLFQEHLISRVVELSADNFEVMCEEYRKFVGENEKPPTRLSNNEKERRLAEWIYGQNRYYRDENMSDARVRQLESLPNWEWSPRRGHIKWEEVNWEKSDTELAEEVSCSQSLIRLRRRELFGSKRASSNANIDWRSIDWNRLDEEIAEQYGYHVSTIKRKRTFLAPAKYRSKRGGITEQRKKINDNKWMTKFKQLVQFYVDNNRWPKRRHTLGQWLGTQKQALRQGKLPKDREKLLKGIGAI